MKKTAIYQPKRPDAPAWVNKWVQSPRWLLGFCLVVAACLVVYTVGASLGQAAPSTPWGMGYGIAAVAVLLGVLFYAVRRRTLGIRFLGRSWHYLEFHVYGGLVFLLLMLMHVAFRVPHGVLTWWLWFLSIWVAVSGLLGLVVQKWIPTLLASGLSVEVHFDRIPDLVDEIRARAEKLVGSASDPIRDLYRREVAPALAGPQPKWIYYWDVTGGFRSKADHFERVRSLLSEDERARLDELHQLYRTKLEMDAHYTLQRLLRGWLYLHVPVAVVLLGLLALHIFFVVYY